MAFASILKRPADDTHGDLLLFVQLRTALASDRGPRIVGAVNSVPNPFTITNSRPPPRAEHPPSTGLSFHQQRNLVHQHHTATLQVSVQNLETSCCSTSTDLSSGKNLTLGVAIKSVSLKLGSRGGLLSHHTTTCCFCTALRLIGR